MSFAIGTALAFIFLDPPWRWIVIAALAAIEAFEILLWLRLRRLRAMTGAEAMLGSTGRALTDCEPEGQVRVRGQIWKATCAEGARAGDDVIVTAVSGLRLEVRPAPLETRRAPGEHPLGSEPGAASSSGRAPDF
jgi:membrane-bound ClpP family serine protease